MELSSELDEVHEGLNANNKMRKDILLPPPPAFDPNPNAIEETCQLARTDFRAASGLFAIVTGSENSGTTIVSRLLMSSPYLYGGFEVGLMIPQNVSDFSPKTPDIQPFYDWLGKVNMLGLNETDRDDFVLRGQCHADSYKRIRHRSRLFQPTLHQRKMWMVDKTPRYIKYLVNIMDRTPGVPVIFTLKTFGDQVRSLEKRRIPRSIALERSAIAAWALEQAQQKYPDRVFAINVTRLYENPSAVMKSVYEFLKLPEPFDPAYLSMDAFNIKQARVPSQETYPPFYPDWDQTKKPVSVFSGI